MPCPVTPGQKPICTCTYPCERHGKCCLCVAHHAPHGQFPACFYTKAGEATYDRSYAQLRQDREKQ